MRIWLAILISALANAVSFDLPPIVQLTSLEDLQIGNTPVSIPITDFVLGNNVTYWVFGYYTTMEGEFLYDIQLPTISQRITNIVSYPKEYPGTSNADIGFQPNLVTPTIYFGVNSNTLYAFDVDQRTVPFFTLLDNSIDGFYTFEYNSQAMILTVSFTSPYLIFTVVSYDPVNGFTQNVLTQSFIFAAQFSGAEISKYAIDMSIDCYIWGADASRAGLVTMYRLNTVNNLQIAVLYSLSALELEISNFSPVSFINVPETSWGLLCDANEGIFVFNMLYWSPANSDYDLLWRSSDPHFYGRVISCSIDVNYQLYVATTASLLVYQAVYTYIGGIGFELKNEIATSDDPVESVSGLVTDNKTQTILMLVTIDSATTLRVLNDNPTEYGYGFMVFDEWVCGIIGSDCNRSPAPAFQIVSSQEDNLTILIDSYSSFFYVTVCTYPTLATPTVLDSSYIFEGVLFASNTIFYAKTTDVPVRIIGWNSASPNIYTTRNAYQDQNYNAPTNTTLYLNSQNSLTAEVYLPLSNYFSGQDIRFDVSLALNSSENVQIATPPIITFNSTFTFPTKSPLFMTKLQFDGNLILAVLSNNQVYLFDGYSQDANLTVLNVVSPSRHGYQVKQFTCVIQQYSDVSMLVVESQTANGLEGHIILWDLFDISDPSEVQYEQSIVFESDMLFGKLQGQDSYLYSLRTVSIAVFTAQKINGSFVFMETTPINEATLVFPGFTPLKLCSEVGLQALYVYEATRGFMSISPSNGGYSFTTSQLPVSADPSKVYLYSYSGLIYILDHLSPDGAIASYPSPTLSGYYTYPTFANSNYVSLQFSYNYFAAFSVHEGNCSVFVFNIQEQLFIRDLVTVIPLPSESTFSFFYLWNGIYAIYAYDGKSVTRWHLGQESTTWQPSSHNIPTTARLDFTVWTKVNFDFAALEYQRSYNATIEITATSGLSGEQKSTSVSIWVINQGTNIARNSTYISPSQLTSGATFLVSNLTAIVPVPDGYFAGADITYAFVLNGYVGAPVLPKAKCTPHNSLACLEAKQFQCKNCIPEINQWEVFDFDVAGGVMYIAYYDEVIRLSLETGQRETYNIGYLMHSEISACYHITIVRGAEDLVVAMCEDLVENYVGQFLVLLNTSDFESSPVLDIGMRIFSLKAVYDPEIESLKIFVSDLVRVLVYTLQGASLVWYSAISSQSLNLYDTIYPTSVEYLSDAYILVADICLGWLFVLQHTIDTASYTLLQNLTGFDGYNNTNGIASLRLSPDKESIFVLSEGATLYQYSLWNETGGLDLTQIAVVPPVAGDLDQAALYDTMTTSETGNYVLFPVYDGFNCRVRVVNMSADFQSRIYTSTDGFCEILPNRYYSTGNVRILTENETQLTVAVFYSPYDDFSTFEVFTIRLQTFAFIFPQYVNSVSNNLITLQLIALNKFSKANAPSFLVNFTS